MRNAIPQAIPAISRDSVPANLPFHRSRRFGGSTRRAVSRTRPRGHRRFRGARHSFRGHVRLFPARQRGATEHSSRLHAPRSRNRARRRRRVHRRRSPGGVLPERQMVGLRDIRLRSRHRDHGKTDGRRPAPRRRRRTPATRRCVPREDSLFQYLRVISPAGVRRHGGPR